MTGLKVTNIVLLPRCDLRTLAPHVIGMPLAAQAVAALRAYGEIPIRFVDVDLAESVELAAEYGLYAYDAHLLACAKNQRAPLLTLDRALTKAAKGAGVKVLEVDE